jgi:hypothetical protein
MEKRAYSSNLAAAAAIVLVVLAGYAVAPDEFSATRLSCPGTQEVLFFDDIETCSVNPGINFGCTCSRTSNRWYYVITIGLLPMISGAIGHFLTKGPLRTRLLFMNAAVVAGLLAQGMPRVLDADPTAAPFAQMLPVVMIIHAIVVSIWFSLFGRVARGV